MKRYSLIDWFKNISVAKKLYFAVGVMALLIAIELFTLWFSINTLSSVRASVGAEGLWSKGQKDALYELRKYSRSGNEADYKAYLNFLKVPLGDRKALNEIKNDHFDYDKMRQGFIQGGIHPHDIEGVNKLFKRFHSVSYLVKAINSWTVGDSLITELMLSADRLHFLVSSNGPANTPDKEQALSEINILNRELTAASNDFSATLGEGSRWLENLILKILLSIALIVEISGLLLTISISKNITKGINETIRVVKKVGRNTFSERASVYSQDEIGQLANSFNLMIDDLEKNISERKKTEVELKKSNERFLSIINLSPVATGITGLNDGRFRYVNGAFENLFLMKSEEMIGRTAAELQIIPAKEREERVQKIKEDGGNAKNVELKVKVKNGEMRDIILSTVTIEWNNDECLLITLVDISDRKKSESVLKKKSEELARSNTELEQFAYVASHDLQEPLRIVSSYVQLIEKRYKDRLDADANDYIHFAVDAAGRMGILISDLLAFSRVETHTKHFHKIDCNQILKTALDNLAAAIHEKNAKIVFDKLPEIYADELQMTQLFQNLIGNGIKFSGDKVPEIKISVKDDSPNWLFAISDNGIGIQKEYFEKIFVIFQRLNSKSKYAGTGIGLAICKKIVDRHGGKIWVESEFGNGTTFNFTIPKANHVET